MNISPDRPSAPKSHDPFITPNRIHVVTQKQEDNTLEVLTCVVSVTEDEDFSPNII